MGNSQSSRAAAAAAAQEQPEAAIIVPSSKKSKKKRFNFPIHQRTTMSGVESSARSTKKTPIVNMSKFHPYQNGTDTMGSIGSNTSKTSSRGTKATSTKHQCPMMMHSNEQSQNEPLATSQKCPMSFGNGTTNAQTTQETQRKDKDHHQQQQQPVSPSEEFVASSNQEDSYQAFQELRCKNGIELADSVLDKMCRYQVKPLTNSDAVFLLQGWNKALSFRSAFSEALLFYWRVLVTEHEHHENAATTTEKSKSSSFDPILKVEKNKDPLYQCFGCRMADAQELLVGLLDGAVRSLSSDYPIQKEGFRPILEQSILQRHKNDFSLECESLQDHFDLFARLGISPNAWSLFVDAMLWAIQTHTSSSSSLASKIVDSNEPEQANNSILQQPHDTIWGRFVAVHVAVPAIETKKALLLLHKAPVVGHIQNIWSRLDSNDQADFGEVFYRALFEKHPQVMDFFSTTDMDALAVHLSMALDLVIRKVDCLGVNDSSFRWTLDHLGEIHRKLNIPTYSYALVGETILDCFQPIFETEENATKDSKDPVSASDLRAGLTKVYSEIMSIVYYPMLREEKLLKVAKEFYQGQLKVEFGWTDAQFETRFLEITEEIHSTGQYTQTTDELEMGAKLAWRNSAKSVGELDLLSQNQKYLIFVKQFDREFANIKLMCCCCLLAICIILDHDFEFQTDNYGTH